jgi:CubicO group peptidase (beta-lactamase class C family)
MTRRISLALLLLAAASPVVAEEVPDAVRKLLEQEVAAKHIAGGVYLVSQKGKVVLKGAVGMQDTEAGKPMAMDTIFRIASMTKPITSVAAMILVEDGKIALEDPVSKYIPEFADTPVAVSHKDENGKVVWETEKAKGPITVRHLITHTSGISYRFLNHPFLGKRFVEEGVSDGVAEAKMSMAENVKRIARVPLKFQPGTGFEYGLNIDVLGRVIEVASGKTLDAFLRDRLFTPLKMQDTFYVVPPEKRSRLAALYEPAPDKGLRKVGDKPVTRGLLVYSATYPTWERGDFFSGGGGLVSTAGDYHRFLRMLLGGGELDGVRVLKADTVKQMTQNQVGKLGAPFGYGFGVATGKGLPFPAGSFYWGGLFYTTFWADPSNDVAAVLMTQLYPAERTKLQQEFPKAVYSALPK